MTVKEIEEKKRMEKELQQKKVYDFHSDELWPDAVIKRVFKGKRRRTSFLQDL